MDFRKLLSRTLSTVPIVFLIFLGLGVVYFLKSSEFGSAFKRRRSETNISEVRNEKTSSAITPKEFSREQIIPTLYTNDSTLGDILIDAGLLGQANLWKSQILFVKVEQDSPKNRLQYYYHNALYQDTNQNGIQDPSDKGFFNPASTVKIGLIALVLEEFNRVDIDRSAEYRIEGSQRWYSFEEDIRRTLIISDNDAANRLILWLGFDRINKGFKDKGLNHLVIDRLMLDQGTLISSPAFEMRVKDDIFRQPRKPVAVQPDCYETDSTIGNCSTATDLIEGLMRINQPEYFNAAQRFDIREDDRAWMIAIMSHTPQDEGFNYEDSYCRFLTGLEQKVSSSSGEMLSKCGVSLFTNTYTDLSYLKTDSNDRYYILISVNPSRSTSEEETILWMNQTAEIILSQLQLP